MMSGSSAGDKRKSDALQSPVVRFNVGGTAFTSSRATLESARSLHAMVLGGPHGSFGHINTTSEGEPFIDADPELFSHVLYFLRRGRLRSGLPDSVIEV